MPPDKLGDVYIVTDTKRTGSALGTTIALPNLECTVSQRSPPLPDFGLKTNHYSGIAAEAKLDILNHLPVELKRVILLDADALCTPNAALLLDEQFHQMTHTQFVAIAWKTHGAPSKCSSW